MLITIGTPAMLKQRTQPLEPPPTIGTVERIAPPEQVPIIPGAQLRLVPWIQEVTGCAGLDRAAVEVRERESPAAFVAFEVEEHVAEALETAAAAVALDAEREVQDGVLWKTGGRE
jgi:hypothetical protein